MLEVSSLSTQFYLHQGCLKAVDSVSFSISSGKVLGIVGESGSGKSVTALSVLGLLPEYAKTTGSVTWKGKEILNQPNTLLRAIRGKEIGLIFQNPLAALNPVFTIGSQMVETIQLHHGCSLSEAKHMALEWLYKVNLSDPERRFNQYPHEFSLGMCQRIMIALTLSMNPALLIADEPTASLDVTIQAQILQLLRSLQTELSMSVWMISHDLGVISQFCDEIAVMYLGRIVEYGTPRELFLSPKHPYTKALVDAIPKFDAFSTQIFSTLSGDIPSPLRPPSGCHFHPRCAFATEKCKADTPVLNSILNSQTKVSCFFPL